MAGSSDGNAAFSLHVHCSVHGDVKSQRNFNHVDDVVAADVVFS